MLVYFSDYSTQAYTADNLETILENPNFDRRKRTTIYSYGFTQTISQPSVREIVDAYLMNGNFNFILVNYNSILAYTLFVSLLRLSRLFARVALENFYNRTPTNLPIT